MKRTYAINDFTTPVPQGKYDRQAYEEEYEPATEHESDAAQPDEVLELDDDPTPKKKQKTTTKAREAIAASRKEPEPLREKNKVS